MVLTPEQISGAIKNPANAALLQRAKELYVSHKLHVKGVGVDAFLARIESYENEAQHNLRKKLAKPATVPIFSKELNVFTKVFSAQGTSRYYDIGGEDSNLGKDFQAYLAGNIGDGYNMRQWMRNVWLDKLNYDMTGLMMVELPTADQLKATARPEPYVTFRSVMDIHDIALNGNRVEYVIFVRTLKSNDGEYREFRVIDDAFDYIVTEKDGVITIVGESILKNFWGYVPAIVVSNQHDCISTAKTSYIWQAIGMADEYLTDASIHSILKKLHGFPFFWMRERGCKKCMGDGYILLEEKKVTCSTCGGSGNFTKRDVSDVTIIPQLQSKDQPDALPVAGYETPPNETLTSQNDELDRIKAIIHLAIWGNDQDKGTTEADTATGRILDVQSIYDKLNLVSENGEVVEHFLTDTIGIARYGNTYNGSSINYGRRYFVRSAYEIEVLYKQAKEAGLSQAILESYLEELIHIKYQNDPVMLQRQIKLMALEPFVTMTVAEVQKAGVSQEDYYLKAYFNDYIERFEAEVASISIAPIEKIEEKLIEYNQEKMSTGLTDESKKANATLGKLNSLSPLVANQLLNSLTPDENRALIGLEPLTPEQKAQLQEEATRKASALQRPDSSNSTNPAT